jgi:hypothetical protein
MMMAADEPRRHRPGKASATASMLRITGLRRERGANACTRDLLRAGCRRASPVVVVTMAVCIGSTHVLPGNAARFATRFRDRSLARVGHERGSSMT